MLSRAWSGVQSALAGATRACTFTGERARALDLTAHYIVAAFWLYGVPDNIVHIDNVSVSAYIAVSPNYGHLLFASMMLSTALAGIVMAVHVWRTHDTYCPEGLLLPPSPSPSSSSSPTSSSDDDDCTSAALVAPRSSSKRSRSRRVAVVRTSVTTTPATPTTPTPTTSTAKVLIPTPSASFVRDSRREAICAFLAPCIGMCFGLGLYIIPVCVQPWHNLATLGTFTCGTLVVMSSRRRVRPSRATAIVWAITMVVLLADCSAERVSPNSFLIAEMVGFFSYRHFLVQSYTLRDGTGGVKLSLLPAVALLTAGAIAMKFANDALGGARCLQNRAASFY